MATELCSDRRPSNRVSTSTYGHTFLKQAGDSEKLHEPHERGLERVAEELMGRRKWKLYQESISKSSSNTLLNYHHILQQHLLQQQEQQQQQQKATCNNNNNLNEEVNTATTTTTPPSPTRLSQEETTIETNDVTTTETENNNETSAPTSKAPATIPSTPTGTITTTTTTTTTTAPDSGTTETTTTTGTKLEERLRQTPAVHTTITGSGEILQVRDWSPSSEKCVFCVDGKLEGRDSETPHPPPSAHSPQASDSESSDSRSDSETSPNPLAASLVGSQLSPPSVTQLLHNNNNMATIESMQSMAVSLAAVAALSGGANLAQNPAAALPFYSPGFLPPWYLSNLTRNFGQELAGAPASPEKVAPSPSSHTPTPSSSEQPLDLSSKASSTSSSSTGGGIPASLLPLDPTKLHSRLPLDTKHIFNIDFRAKPRMSAVAGRRTYTEEELQAALRDIQSGKLGTRRAAVIYGIPRSTLRNKVYKLAMERERESHLLSSAPVKLEDDDVGDDDKELSGAEEEKEVEKALQKPILSMEDILRFSNLENQTPDGLKTLLQKSGKEKPDPWAGMEHSSLGPYIQTLIRAGLSPHQKLDDLNAVLPEFVRKILAEDMVEQGQSEHYGNNKNGTSHERATNSLLSRQNSANSVINRASRKSTTPDVMDTETNDSSTQPQTSDSPSNVILKIPSFKPTTSKNGGDLFRQSPGLLDPMQTPLNVTPPIGGAGNDSTSPPIMPSKSIMSLRDVIAKSISQKFQQSSPSEQLAMKMTPPISEIDFSSYKRGRFTPPMGNMSVIKNHQESQHHHSRQFPHPPKPQNNSQNNNNAPSQGSGGKGTRPKRGKYRNYDRDSLVEAVRAVQRGEMSVHRAGSYYGVPHSTLEYKVKERHLMRPRKRDPKPTVTDEKSLPPKVQDPIRSSGLNDKSKSGSLKTPQKYPPTSPNGLKMGLYDPSMAPLGYNHAPFPFWPHAPFHPMPIASTSGFAPHPELFATQMMQRLQDNVQNVASPPQANTITSPTLATATREIAESLYDGTGANGTFLDGIIRSSLEMGIPGSSKKGDEKNSTPETMSNKALLDQLCRSSRIAPKTNLLDAQSSGDESGSFNSKRAHSPLNFSREYSDGKGSDGALNFSGSKKRSSSDVVDMSNDSNDSMPARKRKHSVDNNYSEGERSSTTSPTPVSRIYVKPQFQEITKPENLKPESLVRYGRSMRDVDDFVASDQNGISKETADNNESASKPEAGQD